MAISRKSSKPNKRAIKKSSSVKVFKKLEKASKKVAKGKVKRGNKIMNKVIKKY